MRLGLDTALALARTGLGLFVYQRRFPVGTTITPVGKNDADDLVLVGNKALYTIAPGAQVKIVDYTRGDYTSNDPGAEFEHSSFGTSHYEVEVLQPDTVYDTYGYKYVRPGSKFHADAARIDRRFVPALQRQVA